MKKTIFLFLVIVGLFISSCCSSKTATNKELFNTEWELEYITGARIAFEGLYPEKKPQITFNQENNSVQGTNSCNGYSSIFKANKNEISFGEPGPTTMMYCEGEGDRAFLQMMQKVDSYLIDGDKKLNLISNGIPVMRFKKI